MDRKFPNWIAIVIAGAVAACAGFVGGAWLGLEQRTVLKSQQAALADATQALREELVELERDRDRLAGELAAARVNTAEFDRLAAQCQFDDTLALIGPPAGPTVDSRETERDLRFAELECEVALLKERLTAGVSMPTADLVSASAVKAPAEAAPTVLAANEVKSPPEPTVKSQCMATTQKGTRCKRPARSNGRCWQHGG